MTDYVVLVPFELNGRVPFRGQVITVKDGEVPEIRIKEWIQRKYVRVATKEDVDNWNKHKRRFDY